MHAHNEWTSIISPGLVIIGLSSGVVCWIPEGLEAECVCVCVCVWGESKVNGQK